MLTVHHLEKSRSHRILWLLEELGVEYAFERHARDPKTMRAPKSLREIHPLGKAPIVVTDDGEVLAESGAVIETLVERHGPQLRPEPGTAEHRRYRYFMHYAEGSLMPPLLVKLIFGMLRGKQVPWLVRPIAGAIAAKVDKTFTDPELELHMGFLDGELSQREHIASDAFTAADIQMSYPIVAASSRADLSGRYPHLIGWLERIRARPAWQRAVERGGPIEL